MIAIGCDHAGYDLKQAVMAHLRARGLEYEDLGAYSKESCDYPVYGEAVARAVAGGEAERGILICGTGHGIGITANKVKGIRAVVCSDCYAAELTRRHNNSNVLALGARITGEGLALKILDVFLDTPFEGGGRHDRRLDLLRELEERERV